MKTRKKQVMLIRNKEERYWEYHSSNYYRNCLSPMDAVALFIAQVSGQIQHSEDMDEDVTYIFTIEKIDNQYCKKASKDSNESKL